MCDPYVEVTLAFSGEPDEGTVEAIGIFAPGTGDVGLAVADLTPGEYIVLCFVPTGTVFADGEFVEGEGPPHFVQGMRAEFTVS